MPFTGGSPGVDGQFCKKILLGQLGHDDHGRALICAPSANPTTPQWRLATPAEVSAGSTPTAVQAATLTKAPSNSALAFTGRNLGPLIALALLLMGVGLMAWTKSTKRGLLIADEARATAARRFDEEQRRRANQDRWHW